MAGLQYKFFPTDFFVPQHTASKESNFLQQQLLLVKKTKGDEEEDIKQLKSIPSSTLAAVAPILKKNQTCPSEALDFN